ncbi:MAG: hypothetical protein ACJAZY_003313 [Spirosomataceae bacterium]|jgi:uncharacterized protein YehS (DUF1456 family)
MKNNIVLRQFRYIFDLSDDQMTSLFGQADMVVTRPQVSDWLKKEEDENYKEITDVEFASLLNGFINEKRGKREGEQPQPEKRLNNNIIFRKLKIALNMKDTDILEIFKKVDMSISKHELSAIFRNPNQSQYRACEDQFLRNFLHGLQLKHRSAESA